jgi:hypothetical protein
MRLLFLFGASVLIISCKNSVKGKNGVSFNGPQQYSDYISDRQEPITKGVNDFSAAIQVGADSAEQVRVRTIAAIDKTIAEMKAMPDYNGDTSLRTAAVDLFRFYRKVFFRDFKDLLEISRKDEKNAEDDNRAAGIINKYTLEEEQVDRKFREAEKNFAKLNNLPYQQK